MTADFLYPREFTLNIQTGAFMTDCIFSPEEQEIRDLIRSINHAWLTGNAGQIARSLDEGVIILGPGPQVMAEGREACVRSYQDFSDCAIIHAFAEHTPVVKVFGTTAVASYRYTIRYETGGILHEETGQDLFVFRNLKNQWLIICREASFDTGS
jgi:hypothetical protein